MKGLIKWGLILGGAYYLAQRMNLVGAFTGTSTEAESANVPALFLDLKGLVAAAAARAGSGPLLTFHEWNYYYTQVRGVDGPAIEAAFPGISPTLRMSVDEWYAGVSRAGVA